MRKHLRRGGGGGGGGGGPAGVGAVIAGHSPRAFPSCLLLFSSPSRSRSAKNPPPRRLPRRCLRHPIQRALAAHRRSHARTHALSSPSPSLSPSPSTAVALIAVALSSHIRPRSARRRVGSGRRHLAATASRSPVSHAGSYVSSTGDTDPTRRQGRGEGGVSISNSNPAANRFRPRRERERSEAPG